MGKRANAAGRRRTRQTGAIAIVFALMVGGLLAFIGLALDLGRVYNRRSELQAVANVAAVAAAAQLNGTASGIDAAATKASDAVNELTYQYNQRKIAWNRDALSFGASPNGGWIDAAAAHDAPAGLLYVQVDTARLGAAMGTLDLVFMRAISAALTSTDIAVKAVAGRSGIDVAPLALCALSNTAAAPRANPGPPANTELVEYGFRRGVGYDLMQLNPNGVAPENFVIDPFAPAGTPGSAADTAAAFVGPYACTGQLAIPSVSGGAITVGRPFPLASLYKQLNSRFDQYDDALCSYATAPPDANIRSYAFNGGAPWMATAPDRQAAKPLAGGGKLLTVADPWPAPAGTTAAMYGPLWAYARAVPYASYVAGVAEPAAGYASFAPGAWSTLYAPGAPAATAGYPGGGSTPYKAGTNLLPPPLAHRGVANRRVLNVALLSCPVSPGATTTATVLAVGKFLMTVPATATSLYAEFGGVVPEQALGGPIELYR
ncbi:pilus assembly protein TadG-related protein [Duganella aceris]|uniref:Pilus assembly protein TadE n=1 Tax=Duganella aceris TaxID=2703883 RepID=A0ABX0FL22_9BURK|nr:pilus assembly protein TadG-related protein [Duganella aceris]NGZ85285.1 pilus assembly protein TadE [Duganella aceris]